MFFAATQPDYYSRSPIRVANKSLTDDKLVSRIILRQVYSNVTTTADPTATHFRFYTTRAFTKTVTPLEIC